MELKHSVQFEFDLALKPDAAVGFVRDARLSLSRAEFIKDLDVAPERAEHAVVEASIPVNAALFGQQELPFRSALEHLPRGARLVSLPLEGSRLGWADVSGEAEVRPHPRGSLVRYDFYITIHLQLPEPDRWGGRALLKMIHYTAQRVLENIMLEFPEAVQAAARQAEASYATR